MITIIIILIPATSAIFNLFHQLTAKLKIGPHGPSAAQPAEVELRREEEELFKRQR